MGDTSRDVPPVTYYTYLGLIEQMSEDPFVNRIADISKWGWEIVVSPMMDEYKIAFMSKRGLPVYNPKTKKVIPQNVDIAIMGPETFREFEKLDE